ncbi:leucine-rich repeat protein [Labilibacter marinus]|uniref:leucine-rich repeat protein n=1 Tax=Labilibacter marinus TaxID=1477105 RepID=UPI00094FD433|nr:leucine-rich repeat protein [Labilibacter marinus]
MTKQLLSLVLLSFIFSITYAQYTLTPNDVTFNTSSKSITAYNNTTEKNIKIPNSFTIDEVEYTVLQIGSNAFNDKELTNVTLPNALTSIGSRAFYSNKLTEIDFPNTLTYVGSSAFHANLITSLVLPNSLTNIASEAFSYNKITSVTLPASFQYSGSRAFNRNEITTVNGAPSNGLFFARNADGSEDVTKVVSYGGVSAEIDFIPNTVTTLGEGIFNSVHLDRFVFPIALETIEASALRWCDLTEIVIPNTVKFIGNTAFAYNELTSVTIGNSVETIDDWCFHNNEITNLTIPPSVKSIGDMAFFKNKLSNVNIGTTVTSLGAGSFTANEITTVNGLSSNALFYARNTDGSDNTSKLVSYGGPGGVIDFIPNTVKDIMTYAFESSKVTSVTFPNELISIGRRAFYVNSLTEVILPNTMEYIGSWAFSASGVSSIALPVNNKEGYTTYWTNGGTEAVTELTDVYSTANLRENLITYTITYHLDGGSHSNPSNYDIETEEITLTDASKAGYDFSGWYTEASFTNEITSIPQGSIEDIELWAKFDITTNMDESSSANKLNIYPTIATNRINIKGNINLEDIYIFSTTGALAKRLMATSAQEIIYVGDLNNGTYIVKIGNTTRKTIIRR